jgi:hypothetical protein
MSRSVSAPNTRQGSVPRLDLIDALARAQASYPRRGLSRIAAAAYTGVSPSLFDLMVQNGRMPGPGCLNMGSGLCELRHHRPDQDYSRFVGHLLRARFHLGKRQWTLRDVGRAPHRNDAEGGRS